MSIVDVYETSEHRINIAHFAAIVKLARVDGAINADEKAVLKRFAKKLNISAEDYQAVLNKPENYPMDTANSTEKRLEYIYDLFKIIYADHYIDEPERKLVLKYAIGMGCSEKRANEVIEKSIKIFGGGIALEDYIYLINK